VEPARTESSVSRRDRLRGSTLDEILGVARRQLVAAGPTGISLRAIAREMGMTAPALYRYFDSLDDLVVALVAACYDDLTAAIEAERDRHADAPVGERMVECCREFRRWALAHTPEFNLLFGTPIPDLDLPPEGPAEEAGTRFGATFGAMFLELWATAPFPVPDDADIEPRLAAGLAECQQKMGLAGLPLGAVLAYMSSWVKLYGAVTMEVFGHLKFATDDGEPLFELTLSEICALFGITR
jgi:AcrR family transcriptional regulator